MSVDKEANKTQSIHWRSSALWPTLAVALIVGPSPFFGGCDLLEPPPAEPAPTAVPEVYKNPNEFQSSAATAATELLNDPAGKDGKPMFFRLTQVEAGDMMTLQGIRIAGSTEVPVGGPIKVKLAGVFSPLPGPPPQAGWKEAADKTSVWLSGRKLDVEQDAKFKIMIDESKVTRKLVQIRIKGSGKGKLGEQPLSFNQLLVRSGYAWVDLTTSSSFDYKQWVTDEEYARGIRTGVDPKTGQLTADDKKRAEAALASTWKSKPVPTLTPLPKAFPVGLWAKNIRPPFRKPAAGVPAGTVVGSEEIAVPTPTPAQATTTGGSGSSSGSSPEMASPSATGSVPSSSSSGTPNSGNRASP